MCGMKYLDGSRWVRVRLIDRNDDVGFWDLLENLGKINPIWRVVQGWE